MTTVTTEDIRNALLENPSIIVEVMDSDPAIWEMVRSRVLTPELLALPELHAQFAAEVREFAAQTNARLSRVEDEIVGLRGDVDHMRGEMDKMNVKIDSLESSIGHIKGSFVENTTRKREDSIALQVGEKNGLKFLLYTLEPMRKGKRRKLIGNPDLDDLDVSDGDKASFIQADHIISVDDTDGCKAYIAIEASFVGDAHDADRAIRNANFIEKVTGENAYAVVFGCSPTDGLLEMAKRGEIIWHQVLENALSA